MAANEINRTTGDVRRILAQTMVEIRMGEISTDKAAAIASLSKEITASMQAEVNAAKIKIQLGDAGMKLGQLTHLGKMIIEDGAVPTLSGQSPR